MLVSTLGVGIFLHYLRTKDLLSFKRDNHRGQNTISGSSWEKQFRLPFLLFPSSLCEILLLFLSPPLLGSSGKEKRSLRINSSKTHFEENIREFKPRPHVSCYQDILLLITRGDGSDLYCKYFPSLLSDEFPKRGSRFLNRTQYHIVTQHHPTVPNLRKDSLNKWT